MSRKILIVDDEKLIVDSIKYGLHKEGFEIITAYDGEQGIEKFHSEKPDLILLDVLLPKRDGWAVCRAIRAESCVPIIMLTARTEEMDRVLGLELGADDYLAKPFGMRELIARVRAALRRATEYGQAPSPVTSVGDVALDAASHRVTVRGKPIEMTLKEYDLLNALMTRAGQVVKRNDLIDQVWQTDWVGDTRTLDVHIRWLREKIERDPSTPRYIQTVRGVGYRFATPEELSV